MSAVRDEGDRRRGILLLILSASLFGAVDGLSKMLADSQSIGQIVIARYALALPVVIVWTAPSAWHRLFHTQRPGAQILRALLPLGVSYTMVLAVRYLPLAEATAILFAGPILVVALSALVLGERVGAASWIGVLVGFAGVLIVARPGMGAFSAYAVFPALSAIFFACFQVMTRHLVSNGEDPNATLMWTLATGTVLTLPVTILTWVPVDWTAAGLMLALGLVFGVAQALMVQAFRHAPASVLSPFSYIQIIAAAIFGVVVFGAVPDIWTFLGVALIIGAGAYVARRQARDRTSLPESAE